MKGQSLLFAFILLVVSFGYAQNSTFDINIPGKDRAEKCSECLKVFKQKPKEVKFSIKRTQNKLYFEINDTSWFNLLFDKPGDGIAVDVVTKDRYDCNLKSIENVQIKGTLLKPVYSKALKKGLTDVGNNIFTVEVGTIPDVLLNSELEFNILFLSDKNLCQYYVIYDLDAYDWDLLDMGVYLDSIYYNTKQIKALGEQSYITRSKSLKFQIPFKKNKSNYSQTDIKPIYDSLRLTDFNIKTINIKGYSSIEGIESRNLELQDLRAKSIVAALQAFQKPTIKTTVSSSENWVEFFNDIKGTKYEFLAPLSKVEIKDKIAGALSREMEPIFKNHRKAVIELELEKKDKYSTDSEEELLAKFNASVAKENLVEANDIQNSIFERFYISEGFPEYSQKMSLPKQGKYVNMLNKNSVYKFMLDFRQAVIVYHELLELEKIAPNNPAINYNIVAIKLNLWRYNAVEVTENMLVNEIKALRNYGIDSDLISRMLVNYHIIKAENLMKTRDYTDKDKSVAFVRNNYHKFKLSDFDYLSLAQFFSYYGTVAMAAESLEEKARSIDINENLLFYYLNLTLINKELTNDDDYRTIMFNAININKQRFCQLFNSNEDGGITFQLLDDKYLRKTYCESCAH
ncbi:OmpA family protein [Gaetbulibacter saemankumensis]|uniref:hypothetical protein n=1 Tax=Gaetbulibacter saemankumensis TaxID=311208 RepID=UPI0004149EB4|nr:hypothetical protein [Gaetbulibacter saemankumensis]